MVRLYQYAREKGFFGIVGTVSTKGESWLNRRHSATARHSDVYHVERENIDILVSRIPVDKDFLKVGRELMVNAMTSLEVANVSVTSNLDTARLPEAV
jgi:hypothetical protein